MNKEAVPNRKRRNYKVSFYKAWRIGLIISGFWSTIKKIESDPNNLCSTVILINVIK